MSKKTGKKVAAIAAKGIKDPDALTTTEKKALSASALTQKEGRKSAGVGDVEMMQKRIDALEEENKRLKAHMGKGCVDDLGSIDQL